MRLDTGTRRHRAHGDSPRGVEAPRDAATMPSRLAGRRILVTRAADDAEQWADRLRQLGAQPIVMPCLEVAPLAGAETARSLRTALTNASWLVVASRRGVQAIARMMVGSLPAQVRIAVVGPDTARAAAALLGRVDLVAPEHTARSLARTLLARLASTRDTARVVVAGATAGRTDVESALEEAGVPVRRVAVYAVRPLSPAERKRDLAADRLHAILLASPSAAQGLVNSAVVPTNVPVITIGPTTSANAVALGLSVYAEARRPGLDGILEMIP